MLPAGQVILLDHQRIGWIPIPALVGFDIYRKTDTGTDVVVGIRRVIVHIVFRIAVGLHGVSDDLRSRVVFRYMPPGAVRNLAKQVKAGIIRLTYGRIS